MSTAKVQVIALIVAMVSALRAMGKDGLRMGTRNERVAGQKHKMVEAEKKRREKWRRKRSKRNHRHPMRGGQ